MFKTQIKICGFTRPDDAAWAVALGVDALGLVFYPPSPRNVTVEAAVEIAAAVGPFSCLTALFLNAERSTVETVLSQVPVSLLQFHGTEKAEFCASFNRPYIKAVPMKSVDNVQVYCEQYRDCRGFLLDSNSAGAAGGSGQLFDWSLIPADLAAPAILAGGISSENVRDAICSVEPAAVDVSSSVESSKGIKDLGLMTEFISEVKAADKQRQSVV